MRSLRTRLLLAVGLVVLASVAAVGYLSSRAARTAFVELETVVTETTTAQEGTPGTVVKTVDRERRSLRDSVENDAERGTEGAGERHFMGSLNRTILVGVVLAGVIALAGTALLAHRLLAPVRDLTNAAGRLAEGDLSHRVPVTSKDELGRLAVAFNSMAGGLDRLDRSRRELLHDVAHELRTPLTGLRCQIEALQDGLLPPDAETLASLHEETVHLGHLVDDLRDLSLATAGVLRLEPERLDLREEAERAAHSATAADRAAGMGAAENESEPARIEVEIPAGLTVTADPGRLQQVLRNLLTNALRHSPPGGSVRVSARRLERERGEDESGSAGRDEQEWIEVTVEDEGPGIAADHLPHLFDRFYRTDPSRSRTTGGAGLGLAIVQQLVEAHGGRVTAESPPGKGARFRSTLPA